MSAAHRVWALTCRVLGVVALAALAALAFTPLTGWVARTLETPSRIAPADAIVVLSAGLNRDATLSGASLRRLLDGILLSRRELAPRLLLLGTGGDRGPTEAEVRARLARDLGVRPEVILLESQARTTREEAARTAVLLHPLGIRRILLVSHAQHLARARRLFERAGFEVLPVAMTDRPPPSVSPEERLQLARTILQELVGRTYYRLAGYL